MKKRLTSLVILLLTILFCFSAFGCEKADNKFKGKVIKYENLDSIDKKMFSQLNKILYNSKETLWKDYNLKDKSFILIRKDEEDENGSKNRKNVSYYAINVNGMEDQDAKEVKMPKGFYFKSVYRFNKAPLKIENIRGNFSDTGSDLTIGNSKNIFCFKYNTDNFRKAVDPAYAFSPFFTHEAFHHYMQNDWKIEGAPSSVALTKKEISCIGLKYKVLDKMRTENEKDKISKKKLNKLISEYISIEEKRKEINERYLNEEHSKETAEGTACYVGLKAARLTNTRYGVLAFTNNKEKVTFSDVLDAMSKDKYPTTFIGDWELYNTGMELCITLDNLGIKNWQKKLNSQTPDKPINLYDILKKYYKQNKLEEISIEKIEDKYNYKEILKKSEKIQRLL